MGDWFTIQTFVAFILGVLLAASVRRLAGSVKAKAGV